MDDNVIAFLQEYCQQNRLPLPVYDEVSEIGVDHCKKFTMRCKFAEYSVTGTESNKKSAKKVAAKNMITLLQEKDYFNNSKKAQTKTPSKEEIDGDGTNNVELDSGLKINPDNAIAYLQEYCQQLNHPLPVYVEVERKGEDHCKEFTMRCQFEEYSVTGTESNKKSAKKVAAKNMITLLQEKDYFNNSKKAQTKTPSKEEIDGDGTNNVELDSGLKINPDNAIAYLQEYCQQLNHPLPVYVEVERKGEDHCKEFTMRCQFEEYSVTGTESNKKSAKKVAAKNMITLLQEKDYFNNSKKAQVRSRTLVTSSDVDDGRTTNNMEVVSCCNYIGILQEHCAKYLPSQFPIYEDVIGASKFFEVSCRLQHHITYGSGPQKRLAKSAAAAAMLKKLKEEHVIQSEVMDSKMISNSIETQETTIETINTNIDAVEEIDSTQPSIMKMGDKNIDSSTSENGLGDELPMGEVERFRNLYHKMKHTDPVKWLKMFCDYRAINPSFSVKNSEKGTGTVFTIEIPSELIKIEWEEQTQEQAKKECSKVVGFMLLMKLMKEYKDVFKLQKSRLAETTRGKKSESGRRSQEFKPFVNLENWLNIACQESGVTFPSFEYQLVEGFYRVTCRLLQHTITGTNESKKNGKIAVVIKMQKYLLEAADVKETDNDLVKSRKVIDFMERTNSELRLERQVNLDEVIEWYKQLVINSRIIPTTENALYNGEYSLLQGPAVTRIVNMDVDDINDRGFKYIEDLTREQDLTMKVEYGDILYDRKMRSSIVKMLSYNNKGKFSCFISIQKGNGRKLSFMGVGTTKTESFKQAVIMALSQLKIFLFTTSSKIENLIFIDSLTNIFPASQELDVPLSELSFD